MVMRVVGEADAVDDSMRRENAQAKSTERTPRVAPRRPYDVAKSVANAWKKPLAYSGGAFWSFEGADGWVDCTEELFSAAAQSLGNNPRNNVMPILENRLAVVSRRGCESVYHERTGDWWNPKWAPLTLKSSQVLFSDQIYDVVTGEVEWLNNRVIHGPAVSLPYSVEEGSDEIRCAEFENLIEGALPDPETRRHFQEAMSCILQPHVIFRGQIVLWGEPHTGKTTLATAIGCCPSGRSGISQIQEEELVRDKFISAALVNRFVNVSDDSALTPKWVSFLKRYTSGSMTVEPKYHQPCSITPTAKLIATCNEIQHLMDASGAATDRLMSFFFDVPITKIFGTDKGTKMTVLYWSDPIRRAGILSWLMEGLIRLRTRGQFDLPASWQASQDAAKSEADPIASMLLETFYSNPTGYVTAHDVSIAITDTNADLGKVHKVLRLYMQRLFKTTRSFKRIDGVVTKVYPGIGLQSMKPLQPGETDM